MFDLQRESVTRWEQYLRKHLQSHSSEYKKFCEKEATKQEEIAAANTQASVQARLKQITLQDLESRFRLITLVQKN